MPVNQLSRAAVGAVVYGLLSGSPRRERFVASIISNHSSMYSAEE